LKDLGWEKELGRVGFFLFNLIPTSFVWTGFSFATCNQPSTAAQESFRDSIASGSKFSLIRCDTALLRIGRLQSCTVRDIDSPTPALPSSRSSAKYNNLPS
jgi:hypothetical protein